MADNLAHIHKAVADGSMTASQSALAEGRTDAMIYNAAWNELIDAQIRVFDLKGQLAHAAVALALATGFYEVPAPDPSTKAAPK